MEPRHLNARGYVTDGLGEIKPGQTFYTTTDRVTTPIPKAKGEKALNQWLIDNAVLEARSRNDAFNELVFSGESARNLPPASKDAMVSYLFDPEWRNLHSR